MVDWLEGRIKEGSSGKKRRKSGKMRSWKKGPALDWREKNRRREGAEGKNEAVKIMMIQGKSQGRSRRERRAARSRASGVRTTLALFPVAQNGYSPAHPSLLLHLHLQNDALPTMQGQLVFRLVRFSPTLEPQPLDNRRFRSPFSTTESAEISQHVIVGLSWGL